ncbi:MAG: phosphoribosylamine--glycine ligase, partial [Candidatus Dadabacteria bacterium]|nr:phosphoribosylamine--glycine ligase [Candidatus Dadabacteria bacterium]
YGEKPLAGTEIKIDTGAIAEAGAELFYASVNEESGRIYTTTSRALGVLGISDTIYGAERVCESALRHIKGDVFMRHDIGTKEAIDRKVARMKNIRGQL